MHVETSVGVISVSNVMRYIINQAGETGVGLITAMLL